MFYGFLLKQYLSNHRNLPITYSKTKNEKINNKFIKYYMKIKKRIER